MIISQIIGGLGNQMFQYAVGRTLALRHNVPLRLDISAFNCYGLHQGFELERVFASPTEVATGKEVHDILGWQSSANIQRILKRLNWPFLCRQGLIVEPQFNYWSEINSAPCDSYLIGYWQSEKYFLDNARIIRSDFTFRSPLDIPNRGLALTIGQANAVSLHIRRGDYTKNPKINATHGVCPIEYYQSAVKYITEQVEAPRFFVFSDDIAWAQANLKLNFPCHFVGHNQGRDSYIDMQLMSLCKHHIIANSSFSWWGAWLNPSEDKIVIAPKKWFVNESNTVDLLPLSWITV